MARFQINEIGTGRSVLESILKIYKHQNIKHFDMADEVFFKVQENEEIGRYAVAKKDLKAGDLIFEETPFAYGPKSGNLTVFSIIFAKKTHFFLITKKSL